MDGRRAWALRLASSREICPISFPLRLLDSDRFGRRLGGLPVSESRLHRGYVDAVNTTDSASEEYEAAAGEDAGLDVSSGSVDGAVVGEDAGLDGSSGSVNTVDALEARLARLEGAMDQLQSGDLDAAEATISALEQELGSVGS